MLKSTLWRGLTDWCLPPQLRSEKEQSLKPRLAILFTEAALSLIVVFAAIEFFVLQEQILGLITLSAILPGLMILALVRWSGSAFLAGNVFTGALMGMVALFASVRAGFFAPALLWLVLCPVISVLLCGRRCGVIWTLVTCTGVTGLFLFQQWGWVRFPDIALDNAPLRLLTLIGVILLCFAVCAWYDTMKRVADQTVEEERAVLRQLLHAQEIERQLIAYDLHDGPVQVITGAIMKLDTALDSCNGEETVCRNIRESRDLLVEAVGDSRRLIGGLQPPVLEHEGLVGAIEDLAKQQNELHVEVHHEQPELRLSPLLESALFRICQESLNNAVKYSHASRMTIDIDQDDRNVYVTIRDNGVGFEMSERTQQNFGLLGIQQRARFLDGTATIDSEPGEGTIIYVTLPVELEE